MPTNTLVPEVSPTLADLTERTLLSATTLLQRLSMPGTMRSMNTTSQTQALVRVPVTLPKLCGRTLASLAVLTKTVADLPVDTSFVLTRTQATLSVVSHKMFKNRFFG